MKIRTDRLPGWGFIACVGTLSVLGLFSLWGIAPQVEEGGTFVRSYFWKQVIFLGVALGGMWLVSLPNYLGYRKYSYLIYAAGLLAILGLLIFGRAVRGTKGWISVGSITIQPAEFMKIALVMALARFMMYQKNIDSVRGLLGPFLITGLPMLLVLRQPDLGTATVFFPVCIVMLYTAGAKLRHLLAVFALCSLAAVAAWFFVLEDYQKNRIRAFADPDGVSKDLTMQQRRAMMATATGGVFGRGLWESPLYSVLVPDKHTDFIFPVIGEEMGFVGSAAVLALYTIFFLMALRVAHDSREPYGRLLAVGCATFLYAQVVINLGMTVGLAPITGLTLPYISYGGSSLVTSYLAVGLVINVNRRWVPSFSSRDFEYRMGQINTELDQRKWIH